MAKSKEKPQVEDNQPKGNEKKAPIIEIKELVKMSEDNTSLIRDVIDVLKDYKAWLNNIDDQLSKIKSRLGL